MIADTTDNTSCVQKLSQPNRRHAAAALAKFLRAGSLMLADVTLAGGLLLDPDAAQAVCKRNMSA